jgi:UDP-glucose 4-epimerase
VTGGAGFIGSHIVDALLSDGDHPTVFDNLSTGDRDRLDPRAEFIYGDVRDPADVARVFEHRFDAVLHLAGQVSISLSFHDPENDLGVNVVGTLNILRACIQRQVGRLIFASSMTIYGDPADVPTAEDTPANPLSFYAVTKHAAERYVHLMAAQPDLGFPFRVTSLRMFNVYGERQSLTNPYQGVLAIFIGRVLRGEEIVIHSDGEQARDFVHVEDVARAWVAAVDSEPAFGQTINIGTGAPTSVNALCDAVLASFGRSRADYPVRYALAQLGDLRMTAADITRARHLLKWEPRVPLAVGMARTIAWARQQV